VDIEALVNGKTENVPKLNLELPDPGLPLGKSNAILKTVPADGLRPKVVYRQVYANILLILLCANDCRAAIASSLSKLESRLLTSS